MNTPTKRTRTWASHKNMPSFRRGLALGARSPTLIPSLLVFKSPHNRSRSNQFRSGTPPKAMSAADEEYNARWENIWGAGLQPGALFDSHRSSPALHATIASGKLGDVKGKRALIPGCGRGYDVITFAKAGASEAVGLELALTAVKVANEYVSAELDQLHPHGNVVAGDFFKFGDSENSEKFDIGYDYTFLCALHPGMRRDWTSAWHRLLKPGGLLCTHIFPVVPDTGNPGPPWPVSPELYKELLLGDGGSFALRGLEKVPDCESHPGREGKEYIAVWERL